MNKINQVFAERGDRKLLSLYFCAGTPSLEGTGEVIKTMQRRGIDFIEVGIPFSDPLADGPVIQTAATKALKNGMSVRLLFEQLKAIKDEINIPLFPLFNKLSYKTDVGIGNDISVFGKLNAKFLYRIFYHGIYTECLYEISAVDE